MYHRRVAMIISIITFVGCYLIAPIIIAFISIRFNVEFDENKRFLNFAVAGFIATIMYLIIMACLYKSEK